ncbi:MAG: hypothetical protein ABI120_05930, partial [Gemmatimonadaceae bacterium]
RDFKGSEILKDGISRGQDFKGSEILKDGISKGQSRWFQFQGARFQGVRDLENREFKGPVSQNAGTRSLRHSKRHPASHDA